MPDLLILAGIGLVSAWMGDRLGIPGAVSFWVFIPTYIMYGRFDWLIFK